MGLQGKGPFLSRFALRIFLSPRGDIYGKGELFLSRIQVLTLLYSREVTCAADLESWNSHDVTFVY